MIEFSFAAFTTSPAEDHLLDVFAVGDSEFGSPLQHEGGKQVEFHLRLRRCPAGTELRRQHEDLGERDHRGSERDDVALACPRGGGRILVGGIFI
jgi:hypothetical protein